jgi:L-asparaginase
MGVGHAPEPAIQALSVLASTIPTILTSRVYEGSVFTKTYGFPGSERDLLAKGLISAGWLNPLKARILLLLLLMTDQDKDAISMAFRPSSLS